MRAVLILFIIVLLSCNNRAIENFTEEAKGLTFIKTFGGNKPDIGRSIRKAGESYIINGWTESKGSGLRDMWLIKIDSLGSIEWDKTFGDNNNDWGYYAESTLDNGIIFSGRSSTGNVPSASTGTVPTNFVAKTDDLGNEIWRVLLGSNLFSRSVFQVTETKDLGYIALGYSNNANLFTGAEGSPYISLYKIDQNGNLIWSFNYKNWSIGYSICETLDGSFLIVGNQELERSIDDAVITSESNILLLKVDKDGNLLWEKEHNFSEWDNAKSVTKTNDGFVITGQMGEYETGDQDLLILKIDNDGNEIWHQSFGGSFSERGNDIIETSLGDYVAVGITYSFDVANGDVWLVKVNSDGVLVWSKTIGDEKLDHAYSLVETNDLGYMIVGETDSYNSVFTDVLLIKTDQNGRIKRNGFGEIVVETN